MPAVHFNQSLFGRIDGRPVMQYTMSADNGIRVSFLDFGGTLTVLEVPDKNGKYGDILLGFKTMGDYQKNRMFYMGSLVGRFANRIANGQFEIDGKKYQVPLRPEGFSLHGGQNGFDQKFWKVSEAPELNGYRLTYNSPDGEEGFPGNLHCEVIYSIEDGQSLQISYTASTDKPTVINLTSHAYFNLSAGLSPGILQHELLIPASAVTAVDRNLIPTGELQSITDSVLDFRKPHPIGRYKTVLADGYDHNYVLDNYTGSIQLAARVTEPLSGRVMEMHTTEPALQLYTAHHMQVDASESKSGTGYGSAAAFCLEAQHFPDSPNHLHFPSTLLKPGEDYRQVTEYLFLW